MNKNNLSFAVSLIALVLAIGGYFYPQVVQTVGASGTRFPNGLSADTTSPVAGEVRGTTLAVTSTGVFTGDVTFNGGAGGINVPTSASATSSLTVGGIQMYSTSSATRICVRPSIDGTAATSSFSGTMFWNYGACL
jgi:hypothetical protein